MMRAVHKILQQIKACKNSNYQSKFNLKKSIQTATFIAALTAEVDAD
jgi:hypothetical protein